MPTGHPQPWEIGEVLTVGVNALKRNPLELIGGFFVAFLAWLIPTFAPLLLIATGVFSEDSVIGQGIGLVTNVVSAVVTAFLEAGAIRACLAASREEPVDFGMFFSGGDKTIPLAITNFLVGIGVMFGIVLLIVPGIVFALGWSLTSFLVVDADESPVESIKASWALTQGHKMKIFLFVLACWLLLLVGACFVYLGLFVAIPVVAVAYAEMYRRISGRMGGETAEHGAVSL